MKACPASAVCAIISMLVAGAALVSSAAEPATPAQAVVILQAEDNGTPPLFAYRRAIIQVTP